MVMATFDRHVAVFAFPFGTHAAPLLNLVQRIAADAPNVMFSFFSTKISNNNIFARANFNEQNNIKSYNVSDGIPEGHVLSDNPLEAIELFLKATPKNFKSCLEQVVAQINLKVTCLLTDTFLWFSADIAKELCVPWVSCWTSGPIALSVHVDQDLIQTTIKSAEKGDQTLDFIAGLSAIHVSDLPNDFFNRNPKIAFGHLLQKFGRVVPRAKVVALNSFDELDAVVTNELRSKGPKLLNVGPLALASPPQPCSDEEGCMSWLDKQEAASVVYLSFGTVSSPPLPELFATVEALQVKGIHFLWSIRGNSKNLLEEFIGKSNCNALGKVVSWAPQLQVLGHPSVGVFVTHGGWNSVTESIACGVPMICRPFLGDQSINTRLVKDVWQTGVGIEGGVFSKSATMDALDKVMFKEDGKRMRKNINVLKETATAAVGPDGSSTRNFKALFEIVTTS